LRPQEATDIYKRLLLENREYLALNVYVALCYCKLDYYDVSLDILQVYLNAFADSALSVNLKVWVCACVGVGGCGLGRKGGKDTGEAAEVGGNWRERERERERDRFYSQAPRADATWHIRLLSSLLAELVMWGPGGAGSN
jgi:hypothetical protein